MAYLLTGFDFARIGTHTLAGSDDGGAFSVSYTSGTYAHRDCSSVTGASTYTAFATTLKTNLDAQSAGAGTYTVTWATTGYTIAYSSGNFSLTFTGSTAATNAGALLGFSANQTGAATYSSTRTPYYYLALSRSSVAKFSRPFERSGQTVRQTSVNGNAYSVRPATRVKEVAFDIRYQALATVFLAEATAAVPWTYEALLAHVGAWEPARLVTDDDDIVYKYLEPDFSDEAREPEWNDYHARWRLHVLGQYLGAI